MCIRDSYYHWEVAPDLLGGIRIQVGDDVKDGSVRSRIDRLAEMARAVFVQFLVHVFQFADRIGPDLSLIHI